MNLLYKIWLIVTPIIFYVVLVVFEINITASSRESVINSSIMLPFVVVFIVYLLDKMRIEGERKRTEKYHRKQAFESLRKELENMREAIKGRKWEIKFGKETATFADESLNHDVYDSLLTTGSIFYIDYGKQQTIQDIAKAAKFHNRCLEKAERIAMESSDGGKLPEDKYVRVFHYHVLMQKYEDEILHNGGYA